MIDEPLDRQPDVSPPYIAALRKRIGWICHLVRWAACFYAAWVFWLIGRFWANGDMVRRSFSYQTQLSLTEPEGWQRMLGYGIQMVDWLLVVGAVYAVWQLMGEYLRGRIFDPEAAVWMRRIGSLGLGAMAYDLLSRPLLSGLMSLHMPEGARFISVHVQPHDLLVTLFLLAFVALAHIFRSAAVLADEHAQIV